MRLKIVLEPSGSEAESVKRNWLAFFSITETDGLIEIGPENCFELLVDLRHRCYEWGLTVNVEFHGETD